MYLGAGIGISILSVFMKKDRKNSGWSVTYEGKEYDTDYVSFIVMYGGAENGKAGNF